MAGGPSVSRVPLEAVRDRPGLHWLVIKNSHRLIPNADVLYACDRKWWVANNGIPDFKGLKICQDARVAQQFQGTQTVRSRKARNDFLLDTPGEIGWGGNSGFQAINLAMQFGARKIVLVGFDMRVDKGLHWHGPPEGNPSPGLAARWRLDLDRQHRLTRALGVEIIIGSPDSALIAYPKMEFLESIAFASTA